MERRAYTFDDVLLIPSYNHYQSRKDVKTSITDRTSKLTLDLPIMTSNMDTITEHEMANFMTSKGGTGVLHRFMSIEKNIEEFKKCKGKTFVSVGASTAELERAKSLKDNGADYFCVDVAHGHARYVGKMIKDMRALLGDSVCIMAGNVATYAGADYLASVGADIIKVGIGSGSVCTTRIQTGHGVPQLTAIMDCTRVDRSIVADGGIRQVGDIVKALAFGADFVMLGGMFAGCKSTPGAIFEKDGKKFKKYRGMASKEVADERLGGLTEWKTAEGVQVEVPFNDNEEQIISGIIGGLRSGLTYAGSATIREMQRKLNYTTITQAGWAESLPHKTFK